ncbi:MAG TPA: TonB-dependent receptor [Steroidobacteraceae bacterium]
MKVLFRGLKRGFSRRGLSTWLLLSPIAAAWGQATPPPSPSDALEEVVVSASRIARTGFDAPTPTTVMDAGQISLAAAPNIGQLVTEMPMFQGTNTPSTTTVSSQFAGQNNLNLRGLGPVETLVLVDGRRFVPSTAGGLLDTNVIPSVLVDRLEVVTGGASAAWGSDAVAGVVNIITKKHFEGLSGDFQPGISTYGDNKTYRGSLIWGTSFAGGNGHFMIAGEGDSESGVGQQTSRPWASQGYNVVGNPNAGTAGQPAFLIAPNAQLSLATLGGLITNGALMGTAFGPGGTPYQFQYNPGDGFYQLGGNGIRGSDYEALSVSVKRYSLYSKGDYDFNGLNFFYEISHAFTEAKNPTLVPAFNFGNIPINSNNPYLVNNYPSLAAQLTAAGQSSFLLGRYSTDFGYLTTDDTNATDRLLLGVEGKFGDSWKWNVYAEYGRNVYESNIGNNVLVNNFFNSADAVTGPSGQPICAANLTNPNAAPGCVPVNLFGVGSPSRAAISYFTATQNVVSNTYEHDVAGTLTGDLFNLYGRPVSLATGAEYRGESVNQNSDPNSQQQNFLIGNPQPLFGELSEKEAFAEVSVPVLHDVFLIKSLDLNAAIRETQYQISGTARTWKLGATYAVTDDVKFRVTRSQDIRAPKLTELYTSQFETFSPVIIPTTGENITIHDLTGGNPNLKPEVAQTLTTGVVFTPTFVPGLRASVDFYNINIKDAITTLQPQTIVNLCYQGDASLCALLTRDSAGTITAVNLTNINIAQLSETGVDVETSYLLPLSNFGIDNGANLRFRALINNVQTLKAFNGTTTIDYAGDVGGNNPYGLPKWRGQVNVTYEQGPFAVDLSDRYVGKGNYDNTQLNTNNYNINSIPSVDYVNLALQYTTRPAGMQMLQYFIKVNNLLNKAPPIDPQQFFANIQTNPSLYDVVGRMFYAGVRFQW